MKNKLYIAIIVLALLGVGTYIFTNTNLLTGMISDQRPEKESTGGTDTGGTGAGGSGGGSESSNTYSPILNIYVTDEYGNIIDDLEEANFEITNGEITSFENQDSGNYEVAMSTGDTYDVNIWQDGYVSYKVSGFLGSASVLNANFVLDVGYKVGLQTSLGIAITEATVQADKVETCSSGSGAAIESCAYYYNETCEYQETVSNVGYYACIFSVDSESKEFTAQASLFETSESSFPSDRTAHSDPTVEKTIILTSLTSSDGTIEYDGEGSDTVYAGWVELIVYSVFGEKITGLSQADFEVATGNDSIISFTETDGTYTFELMDGENTIEAFPDGYEYSGADIAVDGTDTVEAFTLHRPAYWIYTTDEDGNVIPNATVTAGDSYSTTCEERNSGEFYVCLVPLNDTETLYKIVADGYETYEGDFNDNRDGVAGERTDKRDHAIISDAVLTKAVENSDPCEGTKPYDSDGDGLYDCEEEGTYGTDPADADTDDDGLTDGEEVNGTYGYITDPLDADTDNGCVNDGDEVLTDLTNPLDATDDDGGNGCAETSPPTEDADCDKDGLSDSDENNYGTDACKADTDGDGLSDYLEVVTYHTDPLDADTDDGCANDGTEVLTDFTNPLNSSDDNDGKGCSTADEAQETTTVQRNCETDFVDIDNNFAYDSICLLYQQYVVQGRYDQHYVPSDYTTKAEGVKMIWLSSGHSVNYDLNYIPYTDVLISEWHYYILTNAYAAGDLWYSGSGTLSPNSDVTRGDLMLLIARIYDWTYWADSKEELQEQLDDYVTDVNSSSYQAYAIYIGLKLGIITGYEDETFRPNNKIQRDEAAVMVTRAMDAKNNGSSAQFED